VFVHYGINWVLCRKKCELLQKASNSSEKFLCYVVYPASNKIIPSPLRSFLGFHRKSQSPFWIDQAIPDFFLFLLDIQDWIHWNCNIFSTNRDYHWFRHYTVWSELWWITKTEIQIDFPLNACLSRKDILQIPLINVLLTCLRKRV
jgi:hypothetical protein